MCGIESIVFVCPPPGKYPIIWYPSWHDALGLIALLLRVLVSLAYRTLGTFLAPLYLPITTRETRDHHCDFDPPHATDGCLEVKVAEILGVLP